MSDAPEVADRRETDSTLTRAASVAPSTFDAARNTVEVIWSTGAKVDRMDWWTGERWIEELDMSANAVDLSRLNSGSAPLLNTHSAMTLEDQIGVVERAWIEAGQGRAVVRLSNRDDMESIIRDVRDGIIRNLSVGYRVTSWQVTEDGGVKTKRATAWQPHEISFVPLPADAGAVTRSLPAQQEAKPMTAEVQTETRADPPAAPVVQPDPVAAPAAPVVASVAEVRTLADKLGLGLEWAMDQLGRNAPFDVIRADAIDAVAAQRGATPRHTSSASIIRDERDTRNQRMAEALYATMAGAEPAAEAREFMGSGMSGMVRELAIAAGIRGAVRMSAPDLFDELVRNQVSSSDFSYVLVNSSNKHLRNTFNAMARTWAGWTDEYEVPDFKTITSASISAASETPVVADGGEIQRSALSDAGETFAVQERALIMSITRKTIINDDMRAVDRAVRSMALGAYTSLRRAVYAELTDNYSSTTLGRIMADTYKLCSSNHSNLGTTGALSVTTFNELRKLLIGQTAMKAKSSDSATPVMPVQQMMLLVGPKAESVALELLGNRIVPTATGSALSDSYRASTTLVTDAFLGTAITAAATEPYYLVRGDIPPVEIAYLSGRRAPRLSSFDPFNYTGVEYKVEFDFRAYATEYRSIAGNVGA